jgi:hypothetical protein
LFFKDNLERNACDLAIEMGHQQMLDLLQKHGAEPSFKLVRDLTQKSGYIELNRSRIKHSEASLLIPKWSEHNLIDSVKNNDIDKF